MSAWLACVGDGERDRDRVEERIERSARSARARSCSSVTSRNTTTAPSASGGDAAVEHELPAVERPSPLIRKRPPVTGWRSSAGPGPARRNSNRLPSRCRGLKTRRSISMPPAIAEQLRERLHSADALSWRAERGRRLRLPRAPSRAEPFALAERTLGDRRQARERPQELPRAASSSSSGSSHDAWHVARSLSTTTER